MRRLVISSIALLLVIALVLGWYFGLFQSFLPSLGGTKELAPDNNTETEQPTTEQPPQDTPVPEPVPEPIPAPTPQEDLEVEKNLKVNLGDNTALFAEHSWTFLAYSMPEYDQQCVAKSGFSGAVSLPFTGETDEERYFEIQDEILRNPVVGHMVAMELENLLITKKTLGEINEAWLPAMVAKFKAAYEVDPADENAGYRGVEAFLTLREGEGDTIFVTKDYRKDAANLCVLLNLLRNEGVRENLTSSRNYELNFTAMGFARRASLAPNQENKPVLLLQYLDKAERVRLRIGFNLLDKRIETFGKDPLPAPTPPSDPAPAPATPSTPTPSTPAPAEPEPVGQDPSNPTPVVPGPMVPTDPTPVVIPEEPSEPTPSPSTPTEPTPAPTTPTEPEPEPTPTVTTPTKNPEEDPVNQGNAQIGGGVLDSTGTGQHEPVASVKRPDGTTITHKPENTTPPAVDSSDPYSNDGHTVNKVDGSETPPTVTVSVDKDPEQGNNWGSSGGQLGTAGTNGTPPSSGSATTTPPASSAPPASSGGNTTPPPAQEEFTPGVGTGTSSNPFDGAVDDPF